MSKVPRWVQLYNYSKQLNKSKELKSLNASKNNIELEISECTFHPITHFTHVLHTKKRSSHEIINSLNERHNTWNNIKTKKIKSIYIQKDPVTLSYRVFKVSRSKNALHINQRQIVRL